MLQQDGKLHLGACNRLCAASLLHFQQADSEFWRDCTERASVSGILKERLERWPITTPKAPDIFSTFDIFGVENHLFVLYGMDFSTKAVAIGEREAEKSAQILQDVQSRSGKMMSDLMPHRVWLSELQKQLMRG